MIFQLRSGPECGFPAFNFFPMLRKGLRISGSLIGSPAEIEEMLQLAVEKGVIKNTLRLLKYSVAINSRILECLFVLGKEAPVTETPI